jgi:HEAT repeat protein
MTCRTEILYSSVATLALVGCASPQGKGLVDDDASYKIPAIKDAVEKNDQSAIPELIESLSSDDPAIRFYAIEGLKRLTGQTLDYHFYDPEPERLVAIERWRKWQAESD